MKIRSLVKGTTIVFLLLGVIANLGFSQDRNQISGFAGLNYVLKYGSETDYIFAENDFPVTPAHTMPVLGFSYARFFKEKMGFEIDFRYNLSTQVTLVDPSDADEIEIDTTKHYTLTGNFVYQLKADGFAPYFTAGAGLDMISTPESQTITSSLGYDVTIAAPEKEADFVINMGAGITYLMSSNFGIRFDARYFIALETTDHPLINNFNIVGGIIYQF